MTDLDKLIAAVEAGDVSDWRPYYHAKVFGKKRLTVAAEAAFSGSLDAAHALHKAVLPGWRWDVGQNVHHGHTLARVYRVIDDDIQEFAASTGRVGDADTPARAWLLSILKAMQSEQKNDT